MAVEWEEVVEASVSLEVRHLEVRAVNHEASQEVVDSLHSDEHEQGMSEAARYRICIHRAFSNGIDGRLNGINV